jgi:branched-chain amino acid aminotransferase
MSTQTTTAHPAQDRHRHRRTPLTFHLSERPDRLHAIERERVLRDPGFGTVFTDHMVKAHWTVERGWYDATVVPYGPLQIDPGAAVLHYAQEIFEGLKAYRHEDGTIWSFRPEANAARFNRSARRLALPELALDDFLESLRALVSVDVDWVPEPGSSGEKSLYLRPFMFASEVFLGVRPAAEVTYCVIASPAAAYFAGGVRDISLWVSTAYARAGSGGTGAAKCGGNYASSLAGQLEGADHGCDQAVFLDAATHQYIDELGGMNLFLVYRDGRLVTPELTDSILEGVTRASILEMAKDMGLEPEERKIPIDEWRSAAASGELAEVFACGTAAVITPVGELRWNGGSVDHRRPGHADEVALGLRQRLLDIQYGRVEDTHGWLTRLV